MEPSMRLALLFVSFVLLAGCTPPYGMGHFGSVGWTHDTYRLRVRSQSDGSFVSPSWRVSSHMPNGRVRRDNLHTRRLDRDDDGRVDYAYRALTNELELEHRTDGANLWVSTFIVPAELQEAPLERVAQTFVSALSGTDQVMFHRGGWNVGWETSRYEAVSLEEMPAAVRGYAAHLTVLEVQRTDSNGATGAARAALTIVRPPFAWREEKRDGSFREWPVLVVIGYVAGADTFGRHWDDYGRLLDSVQIGRPEGTAEPSRGSDAGDGRARGRGAATGAGRASATDTTGSDAGASDATGLDTGASAATGSDTGASDTTDPSDAARERETTPFSGVTR